MKEKKESMFIYVIKRILKRTRLQTIFLLAITLASNSFAWFIYSTRVSNSISAQIKSWSVAFEIDDSDTEQTVLIEIDDVFPGMPNYEKRIKAANHGDTAATLSYQILSVNIFGVEYVTSEMTLEDIEDILSDEFPFQIGITVSNTYMAVGNINEYYSFTLAWPYESGDDELDTYWGSEAYDFHQNFPTSPSISMVVKVIATQVEASEEP